MAEPVEVSSSVNMQCRPARMVTEWPATIGRSDRFQLTNYHRQQTNPKAVNFLWPENQTNVQQTVIGLKVRSRKSRIAGPRTCNYAISHGVTQARPKGRRPMGRWVAYNSTKFKVTVVTSNENYILMRNSDMIVRFSAEKGEELWSCFRMDLFN